MKTFHEKAVKEFEALNKEQQKLVLQDREVENAHNMLMDAFKVMEEEKLGVLGVNRDANSDFKVLQEEHKALQDEKDKIISKDKMLAKKYNQTRTNASII